MKLQSHMTVSVRGKVIGGPDFLVCMPLTDANESDLLRHATELMHQGPDIFEWRIDGYDRVDDINDSLQALRALRAVIGRTPCGRWCRRCASPARPPSTPG